MNDKNDDDDRCSIGHTQHATHANSQIPQLAPNTYLILAGADLLHPNGKRTHRRTCTMSPVLLARSASAVDFMRVMKKTRHV